MKRIIFLIFSICVFSISLVGIYYINSSSYHISLEHNTRMINSSFFSKVIENDNNLIEDHSTDISVDNKDDKDVISTFKEKSNDSSTEIVSSVIDDIPKVVEQTEMNGVYVGLVFKGSMTPYGKDCCGSDEARQGITATGFDLKQSLTYNDPVYGSVRIVASDKNFKYYSIIKVNDPIDGVYNVIVLDRAGSVIGLNKTKKFDLAVESENFASRSYGVHNNITFEVLRVGK